MEHIVLVLGWYSLHWYHEFYGVSAMLDISGTNEHLNFMTWWLVVPPVVQIVISMHVFMASRLAEKYSFLSALNWENIQCDIQSKTDKWVFQQSSVRFKMAAQLSAPTLDRKMY